MKVLVMGGTRFNGLALVQELVKWGHDVTVLNRGQSEARLPRPVRRLYADRTNHEQLREVLGPEAAMWTSMPSGAQLRTCATSSSSLAQVLGVRPTEWQAPSPVARPAMNRPG